MKYQTYFQCLRLMARRGVVRRNVEDFYIASNWDLRTDMTVSLTDGKNQSGPGMRFLGWMLKCLVKRVRCESFDNWYSTKMFIKHRNLALPLTWRVQDHIYEQEASDLPDGWLEDVQLSLPRVGAVALTAKWVQRCPPINLVPMFLSSANFAQMLEHSSSSWE